jgi:acyl-homoserine-lactone acylase
MRRPEAAGHALGQHHRGGPPGQRDVRRRFSVVPDVDAAQLARCAPSKPAAALLLRRPAWSCWTAQERLRLAARPRSPVPGLIPLRQRMPVAIRTDWAQNSNDSFALHAPGGEAWSGISPLVGTTACCRPRTRSSLIELPELLARGKVTPAAVQAQLFGNRNLHGPAVLPDLLAACTANPPVARGPRRLRRAARLGPAQQPGFARRPPVPRVLARCQRRPSRVCTACLSTRRNRWPRRAGLKMDDAAVAAKVWAALAQAVRQVRSAGFALDAPLGQRAASG